MPFVPPSGHSRNRRSRPQAQRKIVRRGSARGSTQGSARDGSPESSANYQQNSASQSSHSLLRRSPDLRRRSTEQPRDGATSLGLSRHRSSERSARSSSQHSEDVRSSVPNHLSSDIPPRVPRTRRADQEARTRARKLEERETRVRSGNSQPGNRGAGRSQSGFLDRGLEMFGRRWAKSSRHRVEPTRSRLTTVWIVLMVGVLGLSLNLVRIQIFKAPWLHEQAQAQQVVATGTATPRRPILDREGNLLAIDQPVYTLYAHPILFGQDINAKRNEIANALAPLLGKPSAELLAKLNQAESGIRLVDTVSEEVARQVRQLHSDGLELIQQQQRLYPRQDLFANIVGYVNVDREGQAGVELMMQDWLKRSNQTTLLSRSGDGSIIPRDLPTDFFRRDDLRMQLTVDSRLQQAAGDALRKQMDAFAAKRGAVIVMDVQDGSILCLATAPTYDPNKYYEVKDIGQLRDWVLTDLYEPGSTFKPVNVAIAIDSGAVKKTDHFYDEGAIEIEGWPIANSDFESAGGRGDISISEILQFSSNIGMVHMMQRMQPGVYYGWLQRLGLDQRTGVDLPSETAGQSKTYAQFTGSLVEPATTAFGQGFSLTPIKLLQLHAMIANGGKLVTPHVVKGLINPTGELKWEPERPTAKQIFSPITTAAVLRMMEDVVTSGTGKPAQIPGYRIAGKTGTAQKASPTGGYIPGARITSFVGMLPVDRPRYAILAVVDEPQGEDAYGSTVAAPIVKEVMEALITTEQIPPSRSDEEPGMGETRNQ